MAKSPEQVIEFLEDLAKRARPFAEKDLAELQAYASKELGIDDLQSWDLPYASAAAAPVLFLGSGSEAVLPRT